MEITCPICFTKGEDIITLGCEHKFGKDCLQLYLNENLKPNVFPSCPDCQLKISADLIGQIMKGGDLLKSVSSRLIENNVVEGFRGDEKIAKCQSCNANYAIWYDADYLNCVNCNSTTCLKCESVAHPGQDCVKAKTKNQELEQVGVKPCPHCATYVHKYDGCNFITCASNICQGKKNFCWLCLEKLTLVQHFEHYTERNPYRGVCVERDKKQKEKNKFACPGCKTYDPDICEAIANFDETISFCSNCKSHYCLKCKSKINEQKFFDHYGEERCKSGRCKIY